MGAHRQGRCAAQRRRPRGRGHRARLKPSAGRTYGGVTAEERAAARRERLLVAALELWGARGTPQPTIAEVCARARVTTRHFYESFGSREHLLLVLYERLLREQAARVRAALDARDPNAPFADGVRLVVEAFVRPWAEDVRKARVAQREILGVSPDLDRRGIGALWGFTRLIADGTGAPPFVAAALVGATHQSLLMWHTLPPQEQPPIEAVIDALVHVAVSSLDGR